MKVKISAVVLTKNEEGNIVDCLETLKWCDEVVIVDDYSEDRTIEVIQSLKDKRIRIFKHVLNNDFSRQRNFGLSKAKGDWVFYVDADERIPEDLKEEIKHLIETRGRVEQLNGYFISRKDIIWGKQLIYGEAGRIKLLRLAKKNAGVWEGKVHEEWKVKGEIGRLKNPLLHYPHQTISEFLSEINFYSTIRTRELFDRGVKTSVWQIIIYPLGKFIQNYFFKLGFLDGIPGFLVAMMMSFHSFLVRGKLWSYTKRN